MTQALLIKLVGTLGPQDETWQPLKPMISISITEPTMIGSRRLHTHNIVIHDFHLTRRHARIVIRENQWHVQDLGSENGTWLLDASQPRLYLKESTLITQDMLVLMGSLVVQFDLSPIEGPSPHVI
jgi:pSer/pThr/pTyr-binding forkhead associated (FHA) protein